MAFAIEGALIDRNNAADTTNSTFHNDRRAGVSARANSGIGGTAGFDAEVQRITNRMKAKGMTCLT